jgi:hypothetical protein
VNQFRQIARQYAPRLESFGLSAIVSFLAFREPNAPVSSILAYFGWCVGGVEKRLPVISGKGSKSRQGSPC